MGPAVGLGLGRFAYALLLPAMRADLGWSYAVAGAMNTANAAGYLVGALAAAPIAARVGDKRGFLAGVLLTALSLLATGLATDIAALALLRVVAGAAGALSLVTGGALAASAVNGGGRGRPTLALGVYFGGAGFGMVVSAFAVPALVAAVGWRSGWFALGALGLLGAAAALPALARAPGGRPRSRCVRPAGCARCWRAMFCSAPATSPLPPSSWRICAHGWLSGRARSRCSGAAPAPRRPSPGSCGGRCWRGCPAGAPWRRPMPW
jgi:MFS family permease